MKLALASALASLIRDASAFERSTQGLFDYLDSPPSIAFTSTLISYPAKRVKDRPKRDKRADRRLQAMHARRGR